MPQCQTHCLSTAAPQGGAPQRLSWLRANLERRPLPELDPAPTLLGRLGFAASPEDAAAAGVLAALQAFAARVHGGAGGDAAGTHLGAAYLLLAVSIPFPLSVALGCSAFCHRHSSLRCNKP